MVSTTKSQSFVTSYHLNLIALFSLIGLGSLGYFLVIPIYAEFFLNPASKFLAVHTSVVERNLLFGLFVAMPHLFAFLLTPVIGWLSDIWGRKVVMLGCLFSVLASFVLPLWAIGHLSLKVLFIAGVLNSLGNSMQPVAQAALADISAGKVKAYLMSLTGAAMTAAMIVGPIMGGVLANPAHGEYFTIYTPFMVAALLVLLCIMLVIKVYDGQSAVTVKQINERPTRPWRYLSLYLALLFAISFGCQSSWALFYQGQPFLLHNSWAGDDLAVLLSSLGIVMIVTLVIIYPLIIRKVSIEKCLGFALVGFFVAMLIMQFSHVYWLRDIAMGLIAMTIAISYPCLATLLSNKASRSVQGFILSVNNVVMSLAWVITGFGAPMLAAITPALILWVVLTEAFIMLLIFFVMTVKKASPDAASESE